MMSLDSEPRLGCYRVLEKGEASMKTGGLSGLVRVVIVPP